MAVRPIDGNALIEWFRPYLHTGEAIPADVVIENIRSMPTLTPPNEPLTQADLDAMDYDKVWLDYGGDGEWALVVSGRIYALAVLEGAGFEDILRDEVDGETMDRPSGNYTVYRRPPEGREGHMSNIDELIEQLRRKGLSRASALGYHSGLFDDAADALEKLQSELNAAKSPEVLEAVDELMEFARTRMGIAEWLYYVDVLGEWRGQKED